jgi:hypothetical protein
MPDHMSLLNLTPAQLRHAADLKEKIDALQEELNRLQGGAPAAAPAGAKGGKRKISAAGIARIRAAQLKRWAKAKGKGKSAPAKSGKRGPKKMSAAGRARIAAAQKARWAKFHASKGGK